MKTNLENPRIDNFSKSSVSFSELWTTTMIEMT